MTRVAMVTGGASGMGRSVCEHLARQGHLVTIVDLDGELAEQAATEIRQAGGQALAQQADVSDRNQVEAAVKATRDKFGPLGILVTSAAISRSEPFQEITLESWNQVLAVNLTGTFHCVQTTLPDMLEAQWGRIVLVSSSSAQRGAPTMTHYASSKGGVIALTKSLALEFAKAGITVNNIAPSVIETPMLRKQQELGKLPPIEVLTQGIPVGRMGTGDDIAAACSFLCSEESSFFTGQTVSVNGGSYPT